MLLIASDRGVERVACACEVAARAGVRVGMTVAHARSLLAGRHVRVAPHQPDSVARALDRMVQWAFRFSPVVTADYPDGLLLDITGCEHLHAGEEKLAKKIVGALEQWRLPARVCVAPTAAVARAVARYSHERITVIPDHGASDELRFLPVSALGIEAVILDALAEVGVINIDQLLNLPREDLAARFGPALLSKIDSALGLAPQLIEAARQFEPVEFTRTFDGPVRNQEAIFRAIEQLLRELIAHLACAESGVSRMDIEISRSGNRSHEATKPRSDEGKFEIRNSKFEEITRLPSYQITKSCPDISLSLSFPSRDFNHLWSLLRPRLERIHIGYGIEEIVVRVLHMQRLAHAQMELWPDAASPTHVDDQALMGQWLDQIIERLGRRAVVQMQPAQRYLPEEAFVPQNVNQVESSKFKVQKQAKEKKALTPPCFPAVRPSRLFSPPEHALVIALVPDHPPAWISWQGQEDHVVCGYGPERIAGPWWDGSRQPDKEQVDPSPHHHIATSPYEQRDYFVIQTESGIWLWVFRDHQGHWFVHGEWA